MKKEAVESRIKIITESRARNRTYRLIAQDLGIGLQSLLQFRNRHMPETFKRMKKRKKTSHVIEWQIKPYENVVVIGADGHMLSVGDGSNYVRIQNPNLKKAVIEVFNLQTFVKCS